MAKKQSPGYPNFSIEKAIAFAGQIFDKDRKNPIGREVAARHIGYGGVSGASDKALATLAHYGLVEKAGKGQLRVTQTLVDILYPDSEQDKRVALVTAGLAPAIFREINERYDSGVPSEEALKSWLMRENFLDRAINPVTKSYLATIQYLEQSKAFESGGNRAKMASESVEINDNSETDQMQTDTTQLEVVRQLDPEKDLNKINAEIVDNRVTVSAVLDREGLEKLERKIAALKDFLAD